MQQLTGMHSRRTVNLSHRPYTSIANRKQIRYSGFKTQQIASSLTKSETGSPNAQRQRHLNTQLSHEQSPPASCNEDVTYVKNLSAPLVPLVMLQLAVLRLSQWYGAAMGAIHAQREKLRRSQAAQLCAFSMLASPILPGGFEDLMNNRIFWGSFWAWLTAQSLKIFTKKYKTGVWDVRAIFDSGGMPSSHSAMCAGLTTSIALEFGLGSPLFAIALCFTSIVMYDACGVRRHAGRTAEALNKVINELMEKEHPVTAMKLKEVLGHTPRQVVAGAALGVFMAMYLPLPSHPLPSA